MTAATMLAAKSEIGMLIHIPFEPQNMGKIMMQGNRKSNWRVRDRKIALDAIPIPVSYTHLTLPTNREV